LQIGRTVARHNIMRKTHSTTVEADQIQLEKGGEKRRKGRGAGRNEEMRGTARGRTKSRASDRERNGESGDSPGEKRVPEPVKRTA